MTVSGSSGGGSGGPSGERPGTSYFVPGVRVRKLAKELRPGAEPGDELEPDVAAEILRVEVTRVNTGACQFAITFNNWYATTASDRRGAQAVGAREVAGRERPLWPRFKHNAFAQIAFGDRLRIDLRYWPETSSSADGAPVAARQWVPMVAGPVTDMRFSFGAEGATVVVTGEDDLSRLKDRPAQREQFANVAEQELVRRVLTVAEYPLTLDTSSPLAWPAFAISGDAPAEALGEDQSYLDYLQKLAEKLDCEVFVEFADLANADSGVTFHVEPARSRLPPDSGNADLYRLARDQNLIEFTPTLKVLDMPTAVEVQGRHRDRTRPERVRESANVDAVRDELHVDPGQGDQDLANASAVREHFFPGRPNPLKLPNTTHLDSERGRTQAEALLRKKARELMTIEATTIGLPRLRPGAHIEIRGMRPPFDGFFYVTKTVHSVGPEGFRTKVSARRPGMPLPPYQEQAAS